MLVVGLDIETTGRDRGSGAALIQVGAADVVDPATWFTSLVGHDLARVAVEPEAMAVHRITLAEIEAAPRAAAVDAALSGWLRSRGASEEQPAVACGWNVGGFDLPFIAATLPHSAALVTHRVLDLNSVCFYLDGVADEPGGTPRPWTWWKAAAKRYAAERLLGAGAGERPHDAGWDAAEAVCVLEFLRRAGVRA